MEPVILSRMNKTVELQLPHDQASFRKGISTTDQISFLTTHNIEQSFQNKEKFGLVLIDLSAAYDTGVAQGSILEAFKAHPRP